MQTTMQNIMQTEIFESVSRGSIDPKDQQRYNGILYTNTFMTTQDVNIVGLSLFGPKSDLSGPLTVIVTLTESKKVYHFSDTTEKVFLPETTMQMRNLLSNNKFFVQLPVPVTIPNGRWVDISFQLESEEKKPPYFGQLFKSDLNKMTQVSSGGSVKFHFLRGCRQMPELYFTLA